LMFCFTKVQPVAAAGLVVEGSEAGSAAAGWEAAAREEEDSVVEAKEEAWEEAVTAAVFLITEGCARYQRARRNRMR
jgi:hypothetical protein